MDKPPSMVPPTTPGALCTKCNKRPQAAMQLAKAKLYTPEQHSWCAPCRGRLSAKNRERACAC